MGNDQINSKGCQLASNYASKTYIMKSIIAIILVLNSISLFGQWTESTTVGSYYEVDFPDINAAYATGGYGTVNKSVDGGATWTEIYDFGPFSSLYDPQFINADTGFVQANGGVFRTFDGGFTWSGISYTWAQQNGIHFKNIKISDGRIFSSYSHNDTAYFISSDDYGSNWKIIIQNSEIYAKPFTYSMVDSLNGYFIDPNELEQVLVTDDGGLSFGDTIFITNGPIVLQNKFDFIDMQNGYSYGTSGSWSHPTRTWSTGNFYFPIDLDGFGVLPVLDIDYNTSKLYAATIYGKIFYSMNNGQNWNEQPTPIANNYPITSISFASETQGIAATGSGIIYTKNGGITGIKDLTIDSKLRIFPNPSNDIINIETLENLEFSKISLYSIDGKFIEEFNAKERSLDVNNFATGQYILHIITSKEVITRKVVIKK